MLYGVVKGRSVDGTLYRSVVYGWTDDKREATLLELSEAQTWAARLEAAEAKTRSPDNGVYQIKALETAPPIYKLADIDEMQALLEAEIDHMGL